jgi:hypothetical protein
MNDDTRSFFNDLTDLLGEVPTEAIIRKIDGVLDPEDITSRENLIEHLRFMQKCMRQTVEATGDSLDTNVLAAITDLMRAVDAWVYRARAQGTDEEAL